VGGIETKGRGMTEGEAGTAVTTGETTGGGTTGEMTGGAESLCVLGVCAISLEL
jgi:hypothetical protein